MRTLDAVFLDPREALARGIAEIGLRRLGIGAAGHDQRLALAVHRGAVVEGEIGQPLQLLGRLQIEGIDLRRQHIIARTDERDAAGFFIHADEIGDDPRTLGKLLPLTFAMMVLLEAIEMAEAIAFGPPDQAAIGEEAIGVRQVDPAAFCRLFGEQDLRLAGGRIDLEHVEPGLCAVLALNVERLAIGRPIDAREVDVLIRAEIDLHPALAVRADHPQRDFGIGAARDRIALLECLRTLRADGGTGDGADLGFVEALGREARAIGRPPVALEAVHLLLRDELGLAPVDGGGGFGWGHGLRFGLAVDRPDEQPLVAHERDVAALGAERGIELAALRTRDLAHRTIEPGEQQVAVDGNEHGLAVGGPFVADDALEIADALALALHLFGFREFPPGRKLLRIDQHAPFASFPVEAPQVIAFAVIGTAAQHGDIAAIGRKLDRARHGPGQAGAGKNAFERKRAGLVRCGLRCGHGGFLRLGSKNRHSGKQGTGCQNGGYQNGSSPNGSAQNAGRQNAGRQGCQQSHGGHVLRQLEFGDSWDK